MDSVFDPDDFINEVGEIYGKPYLPYLRDLTDDGAFWSYDPEMRLLKTKYGTTHIDVWVSVIKEGKEDQYDHPAEIFAKIRSDWLSLLEKDEPDYEEIDEKLYSIWRGCRVDAMVQLLDYGKLEHLTDAQYWELVQDYWVDTEFPFHQWDTWLRLFEERGTNTSLTSHLPDEVTIYRGGHRSGVSWTTSLETASWFAKRNALFDENEMTVWETTIPKHKIIFFTNHREENEVLLWEPPSPETINSVEPKLEENEEVDGGCIPLTEWIEKVA
jgi:hypothetical protein